MRHGNTRLERIAAWECHAVCGAVSVRPAVLPCQGARESSGTRAMREIMCVERERNTNNNGSYCERTATTEASTEISLMWT